MGGRKNGRVYECVIIDLNTQWDFCTPRGACPVANLEGYVPILRRVVAWTKRNGAPVISALDSHRASELMEGGRPMHCVDGSIGQRKIDFTILPLRERVEFDNTLAIPLDLFNRCQQVIFRQRGGDLLSNPKADRFLTQLAAKAFVVYGNTIEVAVKSLVLGLIAREKQVVVVADACGYWDRAGADLALRQMEAKGAGIVTVDALSARKLRYRDRYRIAVRTHGSPDGNGKNGRGNGRANGRGNGRANGNVHRVTMSRGHTSGQAERQT